MPRLTSTAAISHDGHGAMLKARRNRETLTKNLHDFFRWRVRRHVEVRRIAPEQQIANATADEMRLSPRLPQSPANVHDVRRDPPAIKTFHCRLIVMGTARRERRQGLRPPAPVFVTISARRPAPHSAPRPLRVPARFARPRRLTLRDGVGPRERPALASCVGVARCRSHAPGPPSLHPAKPGYARPQNSRGHVKVNAATDRLALGLEDRVGVGIVAAPFGPSSNSYLGLEPASARSSQPELASRSTREAT